MQSWVKIKRKLPVQRVLKMLSNSKVYLYIASSELEILAINKI